MDNEGTKAMTINVELTPDEQRVFVRVALEWIADHKRVSQVKPGDPKAMLHHDLAVASELADRVSLAHVTPR